ncbi:MAG: hypothetical protein ACSHW0_10270 [Thalassotalea sp.]
MPVLAQDEPQKATANSINVDTTQNNDINNPAATGDWSQNFHQSIANSVFRSAQWFDSFFMEEGDEQISPKTSARIKIGWEPKARDWSKIGTRFKLKVRLPHFKDKVDIIFSDSAEDQFDALPLESIKTNNQLDEESFAAAIRYILKSKDHIVTDTRLGISGGDIFLRARHKRTYNWRDNHSFKIEPAIYYYIDDKSGARLLLEYDYQQNETEQYRINYSIRGSESFHGIRWKHGFYHLKQLSDKEATVTGIQAEGERNGERGFIVDKYTLSMRYRFNALKDWLYFEIEPFVEFPEEENYKATPGLALRVEGFFYQVDKK